MEEVIRYLEKVDPNAAKQARSRYSCFDHFDNDAQVYGFVTGTGIAKSCEEEVVNQLVDLQRRVMESARRDGGSVDANEAFYAEQNARLVKNAEAYYRSMFLETVSSWNLRDQHMFETLEALMGYLARKGGPAKVVVWAHNSHVGDARATEMGQRGELNIGQLARTKFGDGARLIGFTTYSGDVTAASDWGGVTERKEVRQALPGTFELLFHTSPLDRFLLMFEPGRRVTDLLREPLLERAIGVIYRPETERMSHYFHARLSDQFNAVLHFDHTRAVEPLERTAEWETSEAPETFPFAV
jgi:erythromycin esterase-like protein